MGVRLKAENSYMPGVIFFCVLYIIKMGGLIMTDELRYRLEELQSLVKVLSRSLETHQEKLKPVDVSNILSIIEKQLNDILN